MPNSLSRLPLSPSEAILPACANWNESQWAHEEMKVGGMKGGGKKTGWPLKVAYNPTFLWLRFAAALGMFKCPCLLYFPRAVVNAIPSSNIQPPFCFPGRLQRKVGMTSRPWFVLPCLGDDTDSIHLTVHSMCRTRAAHTSCVFWSFITNERDSSEN